LIIKSTAYDLTSQQDESRLLGLRHSLQRGKIVFSWLGVVWNVRMTLAATLLISIFCLAPAVSSPAARYHALPGKQSDSSVGTQDQGTKAQGTKAQDAGSPTPPPATKSAPQNQISTTKRTRHKKKVTASNCNSTTSQGAPSSDSSGHPPSNASTNCPPVKVIVKQGGTSSSGIELAGGTTGNQASNQRDANQMLGTTESNLKKIAGQQLSSDQQDMVKQIRQFMEQSKAAVADGDLDRARTLAWKAQVLSEELVKPAQ
jgi:hypothetical protein